jgi:hypothetical protein
MWAERNGLDTESGSAALPLVKAGRIDSMPLPALSTGGL